VSRAGYESSASSGPPRLDSIASSGSCYYTTSATAMNLKSRSLKVKGAGICHWITEYVVILLPQI
jgi:hypothetical protein